MIRQSDIDLEAMVINAPVAMCIFRGSGLDIEAVNEKMLETWAMAHTMNIRAVKYVYTTGIPYSVVINDIRYSFSPLADGRGNPTGVVMMANTSNVIL